VRLCLIASKPTDSVIQGFLPAAARLGLEVVLLTDQPEEHQRAVARAARLPRPGCPGPAPGSPAPGSPGRAAGGPPVRFAGCDVWDFRAVIDAIAGPTAPDAIVSNSDHLQAQAALAAAYFDRPGKDWRSALRARDKSLMRRRLAAAGTGHVGAAQLTADGIAAGVTAEGTPLTSLRYPVVLKPAEGVASEDVVLADSPRELAARAAELAARRPGEKLLAEEYLAGQLRTLETIGDGRTTWVLGGFLTRLSPLPYFIEERLTWAAPVPETDSHHVLAALAALGGTFGACHTEYAVGDRGPVLIEVNDRLIGDHCDFVLGDLLGTDLFELVLRVHLGQPLPPGPPATSGHAVIDWAVAGQPGVLTAVPPAGPRPTGEPGVRLSYRTLRAAGDHIKVTHTNRDYLGVVAAVGPDAAAVERAVAAARAREGWTVTGPGQ
jgi:biotin carboxylase